MAEAINQNGVPAEGVHVFLESKYFRAEGIYYGKELTVLKGSRIRLGEKTENYEKNVSADVRQKRADTAVVDAEGIVLQDVLFSSPTDAASFVAARHRSGPAVWKTADGTAIRDLKQA